MYIIKNIKENGYPCEEHEVKTDDGYILTMFRIPDKSNGASNENNNKDNNNTKEVVHNAIQSSEQQYNEKPPVLLQHGLLDSACTFIANPAPKALAYFLADHGFDVWLGNSRGNTYSKRHSWRSPQRGKFWQFTFDDMAHYDILAMLHYIFHSRNKKWKIAYIGHSQGTTQMFGALGQEYWAGVRETVSEYLSAFVALAPIVTAGNINSMVLRSLSNLQVPQVAARFGSRQVLPSLKELRFLLRYTMPPHVPAGTSLWNMAHWAQAVNSGRFQMFDFGVEENQRRYGQPMPPRYNLRLFPTDIPLMLVYGGDDKMASLKDVEQLIISLPDNINPEIIFIPEYRHLDFVWSESACQVLYPRIVEFLSKHKSKYPKESTDDIVDFDNIDNNNTNDNNNNNTNNNNDN